MLALHPDLRLSDGKQPDKVLSPFFLPYVCLLYHWRRYLALYVVVALLKVGGVGKEISISIYISSTDLCRVSRIGGSHR